MKELEFEEVLRIAGGLPVAAALDEITTQVAEESAAPAGSPWWIAAREPESQ